MSAEHLELAWLAGFVDGDGSFLCSTKSNGGALQLVISQSGDPELLYRAQKILGFGYVNGPYKTKQNGYNRKDHWRFVVHSLAEVKKAHELLSPYLGSIKRNQGMKVIETVENMRKELHAI